LLTTYLIKKFIPALEDELQFQKFASKASIPQGMGNVARWNVFNSPSANTTALSPEGAIGTGTTTTNEITTLTTTATEATVAEYGEFIRTTGLMEFAQQPGSRDELVNRMSYGAARSIDALIRNAADTTTSDWYAGPSVAGGASTAAGVSATYYPTDVGADYNMSAAAIIGATAELRGNSARGFAGVNGHPNRHFACIMSTDAEQDLVQEATAGRMTWAEAVTDVPGTSGQSKWVNGFMGSVYGTACYRSQALTTAVITGTLDENFVLADSGLGTVSIQDADPQIYINTSSAGDIGNPYRNSNTIAWHIYFATALLDSNRVIKVYSGST